MSYRCLNFLSLIVIMHDIGNERIQENIMIKFQVADMSCAHCAGAITQAIEEADPQAKVQIDLGTHTVTIDDSVEVDKIRQAIREAGYSPVPQP